MADQQDCQKGLLEDHSGSKWVWSAVGTDSGYASSMESRETGQ